MKIIEPKTNEDFEQYYQLRWAILRKPWGQPLGSERDEMDGISTHALIKSGNGKVIAVGRVHLNNPSEAQVRYMAVHPDYRGRNIGAKILKHLEKKAKEKGASKVILQARNDAVNFYIRNGYEVMEKTFLLYNSIQHYLMRKLLK